jgi:hypothetical protein
MMAWLQIQQSADLVRFQSLDQDSFVAGFMALDNLHLALGKAEGLGQELDQGLVGRSLHGRGGEPHLEDAVCYLSYLVMRSAGRNSDRKTGPVFFLPDVQQKKC